MNRTIVIHLSTGNLQKARAFYTALGFAENESFSGESCVCFVISEAIQVMLSNVETFTGFSPKPVCDTSQFLEVLNCLSCRSREEVDNLVAKAVAAGGSTVEEAEDHGFMYQHGFLDPDGHAWNLFYMATAS